MNEFFKLLRDFIIFIPLGILIFGIFFSLIAVSKGNLIFLLIGLIIVLYGLIASYLRQIYKDFLHFLRRGYPSEHDYLRNWEKYHRIYYIAQFLILGGFVYALFYFLSAIYKNAETVAVLQSITLIFNLTALNWDALAAVGTILSAVVALGIAVFTYIQSEKRERRSREKEAIEKILTPIRKELDSFSMSKWDNWYSGNRWHKLEDMRLDYPLQYFWLNKQIKEALEDFDQQFSRFDNLSQQRRSDLTKLIADMFRRFLTDNGISYEITGGGNLEDENIIHAHWSCVVGGKFGPSVTLYSLVMWGRSLSEFIGERKQDPELPNKNVDAVSFSIHSSSSNIKIVLTQQQSDTLLSKIEEEIKKHPEIEEYRKKWRELYDNGSRLIKEVDSWLSEDEFTEVRHEKGTHTKNHTKRTTYRFLRLVLISFFIFGSSVFIIEKLTPSDYTIRFKRECDGIKCEKIVDSERNVTIENEIQALSSTLERFDFFARFTFLRFDFQVTNQSQFIFAVTEPKYEKGINIIMKCNFNGQDYVFSPNPGIIFKQKSSLGNIIKELDKIQGVLLNCNPAPQDVRFTPTEQVVVAPNAQVQVIYNEEKYHLRFLPDKWNYPLTVLQMFILTGIFLGAFYEIMRFIRRKSYD